MFAQSVPSAIKKRFNILLQNSIQFPKQNKDTGITCQNETSIISVERKGTNRCRSCPLLHKKEDKIFQNKQVGRKLKKNRGSVEGI